MSHNPLGQEAQYRSTYSPDVLFAIPREQYRAKIAADTRAGGSVGADIWNCYELSWLSPSGVPQVGIAQITVPSTSTAIVESKSLKLYLGGYAGERFEAVDAVGSKICSDLRTVLGSADINLEILTPKAEDASGWPRVEITPARGECIDGFASECNSYDYDPKLLSAQRGSVSTPSNFTVHSNLFRSLCPVTSQPDWATVIIGARGGKWDFAQLVKYIVSFRNHPGFHEHCCETIFADLMQRCAPEKLCVECCFTRRGGIDINPIRSSDATYTPFLRPNSWRLARS